MAAAYQSQPVALAANKKMTAWATMMENSKGFTGTRSIKRPTATWANEATAYMHASNTPIMTGSCTRPCSRSASSCALPLVVKLNSTLVVMAEPIMTSKVRMARFFGKCTEVLFFLAGAEVSCGACRQNSQAHTRDSKLGITKAMRQPKYCTQKPVESAARAMPMLPAKPLMPIVRPGVVERCTRNGMPTGW